MLIFVFVDDNFQNSVFDDYLANGYLLHSFGDLENLSEVFESLIDFNIEGK